jgi:hypothetical protein
MKTLLGRLFGLLLIGSATLLAPTNVLAAPGGNGNGNAYGLNGGNGIGNAYGLINNANNTHAVPIPGTLLLFAAGWAGFATWRWRQERHSKNDNNHIPF